MMFPHIAELYRRNPARAVFELMHELPPDDPKYAKIRKRLEALGWALFPKEDELIEIDRFTKADVQGLTWNHSDKTARFLFSCPTHVTFLQKRVLKRISDSKGE